MNNLYTIKKGDNLWDIARKLNTNVDTLLELNPLIINKNKIYTGNHLITSLIKSPTLEVISDDTYKQLINNALNHIKLINSKLVKT